MYIYDINHETNDTYDIKGIRFKCIWLHQNSKSSSRLVNETLKVEVGQPLFFYIIGSNKLLTDISMP